MAVDFLRWPRSGISYLIVVAAAGALAGCGGPGYAVGDCVSIVPAGLSGSDLEDADCATAQGTFDPTERIYRVDSIIEGTTGNCPALEGFFPVQFTHEPDDVIYCLVQADGSSG